MGTGSPGLAIATRTPLPRIALANRPERSRGWAGGRCACLHPPNQVPHGFAHTGRSPDPTSRDETSFPPHSSLRGGHPTGCGKRKDCESRREIKRATLRSSGRVAEVIESGELVPALPLLRDGGGSEHRIVYLHAPFLHRSSAHDERERARSLVLGSVAPTSGRLVCS